MGNIINTINNTNTINTINSNTKNTNTNTKNQQRLPKNNGRFISSYEYYCSTIVLIVSIAVIVVYDDDADDDIVNCSSFSFLSSTRLPLLLYVEAKALSSTSAISTSTISTSTKRSKRNLLESNNNNNGTTQTQQTTCYGSPLIIPHTITSRKKKLSPPKANKLIIAHRGASAHLPEHSLAAYRLAYELGADYIEPDLVPTKDNHLIAVHKMDLNITTNVHDIFGPNRATFSKFTNTTGYWSYEFTLQEIKQLRIKQRLPSVRSKQYDGLFEIPTLTEILQLQKEWNTNIIPKRCTSSSVSSSTSESESSLSSEEQLQLQQVGIYAELKDTAWLMEDTGIDLVDLFFQHQLDNSQLWLDTIGGQNSCRATHHLSDYKIPPLILQSFDGQALQKVHQQWNTRTTEGGSIGTTPIPPMVLLVDKTKCNTDSFWYEVEETWRDIISGVGPDKVCLKNKDFIEHAEMAKLAIHPWTVRPELEFHVEFDTVNEELEDLFCHHIHGIFTEVVSDAILASIKVMDNVECNIFEEEEKREHSNKGRPGKTSAGSSQQQLEDGGGVSVGFVLLLLLIPFGIIGCSVFLVLQWQQKMRRESLQKVPTNDEDDDDDDDANNNNFHDEVEDDDDDDDIGGGRQQQQQQQQQVGFHDDIIGDEEEERHEIT